jgi:hypothetical protein
MQQEEMDEIFRPLKEEIERLKRQRINEHSQTMAKLELIDKVLKKGIRRQRIYRIILFVLGYVLGYGINYLNTH